MLLRTRLYHWLNPLFGTPTKVSPETYTRTDEIFAKHTMPLLERIAPLVPGSGHVLIVGCGSGVEINWFAERAASVVAVDVSADAVAASAAATAAVDNVTCHVVDSATIPFDDAQFDLIFMHDVCEHLLELEACFAEYHRVLKPGGRLVNVFSPLFYSPYGAHLQDALKIPWGHLIFGVRPVVEVRNRYYADPCTASTWAELGLNRVTESRYRAVTRQCGFASERYEVHTSKGLPLVSRVPLLKNLFIMGITDILTRREPGPSLRSQRQLS